MNYDNKIARYTEADLFAAFIAGARHGSRKYHPLDVESANKSPFNEFKVTLNKPLTWDDIKNQCPSGSHILHWLNRHYTPPKGLNSYVDIIDIAWNQEYENPWEYLKYKYPDLTDVKLIQ